MYETSYATTGVDATSGGWAALGAFLATFWILMLLILVIGIVAMWRIFAKAGKPGWAAIVPIYNIIVMLELIGRPVWWILLYFIPIVNVVVAIIMMLDLAKVFGKSVMFGIFGNIIFSPIGILIIAFGDAQYIAPGTASKTE